MDIFKRKLHRTLEKGFKLKKNSLQKPFETLKVRYKFTDHDILRVANECATYCIENDTDYVVTFNFYIACLNNPKKTEVAESANGAVIDREDINKELGKQLENLEQDIKNEGTRI